MRFPRLVSRLTPSVLATETSCLPEIPTAAPSSFSLLLVVFSIARLGCGPLQCIALCGAKARPSNYSSPVTAFLDGPHALFSPSRSRRVIICFAPRAATASSPFPSTLVATRLSLSLSSCGAL